MQIASKELEIKRLEEEESREGITRSLNDKESRLKEINDSIMREREAKDRAGSSHNDAREVAEKHQHESVRLNDALQRISNTYTKVNLTPKI